MASMYIVEFNEPLCDVRTKRKYRSLLEASSFAHKVAAKPYKSEVLLVMPDGQRFKPYGLGWILCPEEAQMDRKKARSLAVCAGVSVS